MKEGAPVTRPVGVLDIDVDADIDADADEAADMSRSFRSLSE